VGVAHFWLTYRRKYGSRRLGVLIVDSTSIDQARLDAAADWIDEGRKFVEGIEMELAHAALVPAMALSRMLSPEEAHDLIDQFERDQGPASVKREDKPTN
jgi:hypothetical protein